MAQKILKYILIITLIFQCILHLAIPLMPHYLNDSAWYFMYKTFLFEGVWIHEDLYPKFHSPIMYYCSLGYPLLLYVSEGISSLFGCTFAFVLLQMQFVFYLLSARFIWLICFSLYGRLLSSLIVIAYLWYLPFFNYAHLVMSESWFICCMLATICSFKKALNSNRNSILALSFFIAGYTFLVRPIAGILLPLMFSIFFLNNTYYKKRLLVLATSILFFLFPIVQSGFNKIQFSTWSIREGFSWNLWNRVVAESKFDPNISDATKRLRVRLKDSTFVASNQHWWDITSQLCGYGMQPKEIQNYCMDICLDGIKKQPLKYMSITLERGLWSLPTITHETICIYPDAQKYLAFLKSYSSKHHAPLLKVLNPQIIGGNPISKCMLVIYSAWNLVFELLQFHLVYISLYVFLIISIVLGVIEYYKSKKINPLNVFIITFAIGMSLAACAFEVLHSRYFLPVIVLELIIAGNLLKRLVKIKN